MSSYANGTTVEVYASQLEVMKLLAKFGIKKHAFASDDGSAQIMFERNALSYRVEIEMPDPELEEFTTDRYGKRRPQSEIAARYEGENRRRWRCLVLIVKAKLIAVEDHVTTFEKEFMAYAVLSTGQTVADVMLPRMLEASASGKPLALPGRSS